MKLAIPIVDLKDGDILVATERDGRIYPSPFGPLTISVVKQTRIEYHIIEQGRPGQLHVNAYPPGVLMHVVRGEQIPGASKKP